MPEKESVNDNSNRETRRMQSTQQTSSSPSSLPYRVIFPNSARQQQQQQQQRSSPSSYSKSAPSAPYTSTSTTDNSIARAVLMGNTISEEEGSSHHNDDGERREIPSHAAENQHNNNNSSSNTTRITTSSSHEDSSGSSTKSSMSAAVPLAFPSIQQQQQQHERQQPMMIAPYQQHQHKRPKSGLSVLLDHEQEQQEEDQTCTCGHTSSSPSEQLKQQQQQQQHQPSDTNLRQMLLRQAHQKVQDEADSASGPPPAPLAVLGHSAPTIITTLPSVRRMPAGAPPMVLWNNNNSQDCNCAAVPPPSYKTASTRHSKRLSLPSPASRHLRQSSLGLSAAESSSFNLLGGSDHKVRRCISSKELGTLAPPSGSPYANMLHQREALENEMRDRLRHKRDSNTFDELTPQNSPHDASMAPIHHHQQQQHGEESSTSSSSQRSVPRKSTTTKSEYRHQRRAAHNRAVVDDLCDVVADLFVAESKLINPTKYGVSYSVGREQILKSVHNFIAKLPTRYALGADTPSEVLLHMRLMAVARSDNSKSVVHIVNLDNDSYWTDNFNCTRQKSSRQLRLVTICCADAVGLLEYITRILGTGGSRVLDADVMLSSDRIVLDRFVVEMNGRLRLDKLAQLIESFVKKAKEKEEHDRLHKDDCSCQDGSLGTQSINGPLYFNPEGELSSKALAGRDFQEEMDKAVPLTEVLASPNKNEPLLDPNFAQLKRHFSMPNELARHGMHAFASQTQEQQQPNQRVANYPPHQNPPFNENLLTPSLSDSSYHGPPLKPEVHLLDECPGHTEDPCPTHGVQLQIQAKSQPPVHLHEHPSACPAHGVPIHTSPSCPANVESYLPCPTHVLLPRPNRLSTNPSQEEEDAAFVSDDAGADSQSMRNKRPLINRRAAADLDRVAVEGESIDYVTVPPQYVSGNKVENRVVPLIPFDELMLIEAVGMGRVSTIYRAAWQNPMSVQMVALKVAMVNPQTGDLSHVDELRREADIAARLKHPNVCDLVGVAADSECFCLAYDYCEGGSVLSLLSDTSRYYEYLPIALDVANGMAYLHSRDVIHRDLKPSNVLLTRDHRAKIADFGMSVANAGQELTAETGTYRYMAPEVIRHESYSSNADVYSFGVFLWQLITRQVPFASMTPVQAAYAVAEGRRPEIPESTPARLREIIEACWHQDSHKRPSFTYIAMALADYVKMSFSPASVGAQTLQIANDMLATVAGNSNVNVDFTTPVADPFNDSAVGLEI